MIYSIWVVAVVIQMAIVSILAFQFFGYKSSTSSKSRLLSIVIAAHNEKKNLEKLIPKLLEQTYSNFEILVALDRSDDGSREWIERIKDKRVKWISIASVPHDFNEKKYALQEAIKLAKGEWIIFTDADCVPASKKWVDCLASKMDDRMILLGYSPYLSNGSLLQSFIQYEAFLTAFHYLSAGLMGKPYMGVGRNMAIERSFFIRQGGYEDFKSIKGGDDDLFIQKNATPENTAIVLGKHSMIFSYPHTDWDSYFRQKTRHLSVGTYYKIKDQIIHVIFNSTLLLFWALLPFLRNENILPIILFYLFIKLIGYRFAQSRMGSGFNYILFPFVDCIYAILIPVIALRSKLVKDIRWKN